jgi:hypothetical protein
MFGRSNLVWKLWHLVGKKIYKTIRYLLVSCQKLFSNGKTFWQISTFFPYSCVQSMLHSLAFDVLWRVESRKVFHDCFMLLLLFSMVHVAAATRWICKLECQKFCLFSRGGSETLNEWGATSSKLHFCKNLFSEKIEVFEVFFWLDKHPFLAYTCFKTVRKDWMIQEKSKTKKMYEISVVIWWALGLRDFKLFSPS